MNSVPKLLVIDPETGDLLNNNLKMCLVEYVHEFCSKQIQLVAERKLKPRFNSVLTSSDKNMSKNFNLNFDFDMYDIFDDLSVSRRSATSSSSQHPTTTTTTKSPNHNTNINSNRLIKHRKRRLNRCLLGEFNENLIEVGQQRQHAATSDDSMSVNKYYLIYFCSNFTSSNTRQQALFEQIVEFLSYIREKIECSIKIVLVSSDFFESDYEKLLEKHRVESNFDRMALKFSAKMVKERLFQKLHVTGIPWFSLIDVYSGEILCENLKIFILNSQLREMIF